MKELEFNPGTYFCVGSPGIFPDVIELATRSKVSHAGVITSVKGDIVEAMPGGVRKSHVTQYAGRYLRVSGPEGTPEQRCLVAEAAECMVGVPYNELAIIDDGLECLGVFWKWLADIANRDHEVICSQMVALCGKSAGFDWSCDKKRLSEVTPADLDRRHVMYQVRW